jgi:hypothetical protein
MRSHAVPAPPIDYGAYDRPFWTRVDIGAFEWHGPQHFMPSVIKETPLQ